jgi:tetratricopeptide (TPR) repeat protein
MRWAPVLLVASVLATYAPSFGNGFVYDDHEVFVEQPAPASAGDVARLFAEPHFHGLPYWRPVVRASLLVQKALHGDHPLPFHVANAAVAALAALAAYALLRAPGLAVRPELALLAAFAFVAHPLGSSAVLPIASGRETSLPVALVVLAVGSWVRGDAAGRAGAHLAFALALAGKEQAVVTPALFALADAFGVARDSPRRAGAWLRRFAPSALLLLAYAALRAWLFAGSEVEWAVARDPSGPALSFAYALQTIFAPFRGLAYEPEPAVWWSWPRLALGLLAGLALFGGSLARGGATRRLGGFWLGWFTASLLPTANLLAQEARFDERYVFLALLAPLGFAAHLVSQIERAGTRRLLLAAGAAAAAGAALVTLERAGTFRDDAAFAEQWLRTNPRSAEAHHALGVRHLAAGRPLEALAHLEAAVGLDPAFADARTNLGAAYAVLGRVADARRELAEAVRLAPDHPEAHNALGLLLAAEGRFDEARTHYERALRAAPRSAQAHNNLGTTLARQGRIEAAIAHFETALALRPDYADARRNLALALRSRSTPPEP